MSNEYTTEHENPLARDFSIWSLLEFAFPTIMMMLFMGLYTIVDTIFVSQCVDIYALSALNIVCPVINLMVGAGTMLATGGSAIVARKMGAGDMAGARRDFTLIIGAGAGLGLLVAGFGIMFLDQIIRGLGASELLFPYCKEYLFVLLLFAPAGMLQVLFQNLMVTAGRPGVGMLLGISAGAVNILGDYLFMVPMGMGIRGAALGTGLGYLLPAIAGILFFTLGKRSGRASPWGENQKQPMLYFCRPVLDIPLLAESCFNGSSEMVSQSASAVTTFFFNRTMMRLEGEAGVAAVTIMIYTQFLLTTLYIGFSMGVAPVISYNYGKGDRIRLKKIFRMCVGFLVPVSVLLCSMAFASGPMLSACFAKKGTVVYTIAQNGFRIFPLSFLFCGMNIFISAAFTALSNGKLSAVLSFLRTFGLVLVMLLVLPEFLGVNGVWLAVPMAELVTMIVAVILCKKSSNTF